MPQYGFFFDQSRCTGCNSCVLACKQWHNLAPGPVKWMRAFQWEKGTFPGVRLHHLAIPCYHCHNPVCMTACPNEAIRKDEKYGAVLVDSDRCQGSRKCWRACPYGVPQYESDGAGVKMSKCNMCVDRLEEGLKPICVLSCSMRALEFGPLDELEKKYGKLRRLEDMPRDSITSPAVIFKPADPKRAVVPWDYEKALRLWQKRQPFQGEPLPDIFASSTEVTGAPHGIVGRNRLVLKTKSAREVIYYTTDDE